MTDFRTESGDDATGDDASQDSKHLDPPDPIAAWRRGYDTQLRAAVTALTAAARLSRPVLEPSSNEAGESGWRVHPTKTEQNDWAEFVTLAVAGAVANIGDVDAALAGRPGSWEAERVRSVVGEDPKRLLEQRTEPVRVRVAAAGILEDLMDVSGLYDESHQILSGEFDDAMTAMDGEFDDRPFVWQYRIEAHQGANMMVPVTEDAPAFDEARWREDLVALGVSPEGIASVAAQRDDPNSFMFAVFVSRDDAARAALVDLAARRRVAEAPYVQRMQALEDLQDRERTEYAHRLQVEIEAEAARRFPGLEVVVDLDLDRYAADAGAEGFEELDEFQGHPTPEAQLFDHARMHTPLPGSGLAPLDYPATAPIAQVEREAGRLPHTRLSENPEGGV